VNARAHGIYS
jgi:1,2-dihydroxy-3-keto-5-methylthiopentene dioxygenase